MLTVMVRLSARLRVLNSAHLAWVTEVELDSIKDAK